MNLKPCPLCGGKAIIKKETLSDGRCSYDDWLIRCSKCDLSLQRAADNYYGRDVYMQEEAITDWNKRIGE